MIESMLNAIVKLTIQTSILIIVISLLRRGLQRWIQPKWSYALWFLVLLKLTIPWLPTSAVSVEHFIPFHHLAPFMTSTSESYHDHSERIGLGQQVTTERTSPNQITLQSFPVPADNGQKEVPAKGHRVWGWTFWLGILWLAGVLLFIVRAVVQYRQSIVRQLRTSRPIEEQDILHLLATAKQEIGIRQHIQIYYCPTIKSPALIGLFKPTILLPFSKITPDQHWDREAISFALLHELWHWKRKDIWANVWFYVMLVLHWFNPLLWLAYRQFRYDQEAACDAAILAQRPEQERIRYGLVLLQTLETQQQASYSHVGVSLFGNKKAIRRRIELIAKYKKPRIAYTFIATVLFALLAVTFLTNAPVDSAATAEQGESGENAADAFWQHDTPVDPLDLSDSNDLSRLDFGEFTTASLQQSTNRTVTEDSRRQSASEFLPLRSPVDGQVRVVLTFGFHPALPEDRAFHPGIDLVTSDLTSVFAVADGTVEQAEYDPAMGNLILLDRGQGWRTAYFHLAELHVSPGDSVEKGALIGKMGSTGRATGVHLHFEIHRDELLIDPMLLYTTDEHGQLVGLPELQPESGLEPSS